MMFGRVVSKSSGLVAVIGEVDELSAAIGCARAVMHEQARNEFLEQVQRTLVLLMGELSVLPEDRSRKLPFSLVEEVDIERLEVWVNRVEVSLPKLNGWDYPGVNESQARLHMARTICRRAERALWALIETDPGFRSLPARYLNRLADVLWLFARDAGAPNPFGSK